VTIGSVGQFPFNSYLYVNADLTLEGTFTFYKLRTFSLTSTASAVRVDMAFVLLIDRQSCEISACSMVQRSTRPHR
jgi:hypothetical protein